MKSIAEILKQVLDNRRLFALAMLLLTMIAITYTRVYYTTDDCNPIRQENLKMHEDFAKISAMLREERLRYANVVLDTISDGSGGEVIQLPPPTATMDQVIAIADQHTQ